ncbi:MAG: glycosyltransferase family 1 protein [Planctomycetota bacterium]|nr:MAG: glycosyltransferase family 1 protein [Planctomycetota bacterium]
MKVLHLHDSPHILGGATVYLRRLLPEMQSRGVENWLYSLDRPGVELCRQCDYFPYVWPDSAWKRRRDFHHFHKPLADHFRNFISEVKPDLIHLQNVAAFRSTLFPSAGKSGVPVLMTVHDFSLSDPNPHGLPRQGWSGKAKQWLDQRSLSKSRRLAFQHVDRFLCPTEALRQGVAFPAEKSEVLRLPIARAEASPLPPLPLKLFFAGTLYRSKGVDVLLQALALADGKAKQAQLDIAGEGDQNDALQAQVQELGLDSRVRFLGYLKGQAMEDAYQRANLQVLPSRVPENSPLTVLESGARGRPSVASHAGGVPELIEPPSRGWTFANEDPQALAKVFEEAAENPQALADRGQAMQAWVRHNFDPTHHWDAVHQHYKDLAL